MLWLVAELTCLYGSVVSKDMNSYSNVGQQYLRMVIVDSDESLYHRSLVVLYLSNMLQSFSQSFSRSFSRSFSQSFSFTSAFSYIQ